MSEGALTPEDPLDVIWKSLGADIDAVAARRRSLAERPAPTPADRAEGIRYAARRMREDGVNVEGFYDPEYAMWLDDLASEQEVHR